jgi:hypothetical protein
MPGFGTMVRRVEINGFYWRKMGIGKLTQAVVIGSCKRAFQKKADYCSCQPRVDLDAEP